MGAELAKLALASAYTAKNERRASREIAEKAQRADEARQLGAMKDAADQRFTAGLVGGFATVASAGLSAWSSAKANAVDTKAVPQGATANQLAETDRVNKALERCASSASAGIQASAKVIEGTAKLAGTALESSASAADREATAAQQAAGHEKNRVEDDKTAMEDAQKLANRTLDFYREYQTAKADAQRAALFRA